MFDILFLVFGVFSTLFWVNSVKKKVFFCWYVCGIWFVLVLLFLLSWHPNERTVRNSCQGAKTTAAAADGICGWESEQWQQCRAAQYAQYTTVCNQAVNQAAASLISRSYGLTHKRAVKIRNTFWGIASEARLDDVVGVDVRRWRDSCSKSL